MKDRKTPMRRCIGCRESFPQNQLIRMTLHDDEIHVDRKGKSPGRGVYLCRKEDCIEKARKSKALQRNYKREFRIEITDAAFDEALAFVKEVVNGEEESI
jgi:uncharacterized protein